jgi:uncharacterized membrane protein
VLRGLAILLIGQVLEGPLVFLVNRLDPPAVPLIQTTAPPPIDGTTLYWAFMTLSGLGLTLMACGVLVRLRPAFWLALSALCVVATHTLLPSDGKPGPAWFTFLLAPGLSRHVLVLYTVIPWLAIASAGMYFGYWWRGNPDIAARRVWIAGGVLLITGIAIRALGGWGNIRLPRDSSWIEFLNNVKYPPSLVFSTMSLGIDLLLLAVLARLPAGIMGKRSPLIVFGQTPLFFYAMHFCLLALSAVLFYRRPGTLQTAYVVWAAVIVALYPACSWYRQFKLGKPPESLWRMF